MTVALHVAGTSILECIIKIIPNGIFTSVGKYSNSDVELTVEFPPIYLGQPF